MNKYDSLETTPTFGDKVYESLPPFLKELTDQFTDPREKDVVLTSSLTILSGCFTGITGKYRDDWMGPNLYAFIVAPPASSKGVMKYARLLGKATQTRFKKANADAKTKYEAALSQWKRAGKKNKEVTVQGAPIKPALPVLFLPGNSSAASIYKLLNDSGGVGIICETEADTLTGAIKQDWGNFSHLLRGAFHHERISMSRSGDELYLEVERPRVSTLLTGTPDQVSRLIGSTEDGLCSRFLFYCYSRELKWIDPTPCKECSDLSEYFELKSEAVDIVKKELDKANYTFNLTDQQFEDLSERFSKKLDSIKLFTGNSAGSVVYRLGVIGFRIAMLLTVLREMENLEGSKNLQCAEQDFEAAMNIVDVLFEHSMVMYALLPKQGSLDFHPKLRQFYLLLPNDRRFSRKKANEIGQVIGISERSVGNYIERLSEMGKLENPDFGNYQKTDPE